MEDNISKDSYQKQREGILTKLQELKNEKNKFSDSKDLFFESIENFLELCKQPLNTYVSGNQEEKRELLEIITSNLTINQRKVCFSMVSPYSELANRNIFPSCTPRGIRTPNLRGISSAL